MKDFRGETIYFIVIDRFHDGDPSNNHGKNPNDCDPTHRDWWKYWGGDLQGIVDKLDYIQSLGASAIWITPVFDQVDDLLQVGDVKMAPYHGYWTKDFKRIDDHLVQRPEDVRVFERNDTVFDELLLQMHARNMSLVLDIVCNHSNPHGSTASGELYDDGRLICRYDTDTGGWYRHLGNVENWNDLWQIQNRDLCGLSDFNEETYEYRVYIKDAMRKWLDKGVDAFRIDTVKHMPVWFWQEFTGDMHVHRPDLFMFGEWFQGGCNDPLSVEFASKSGMSILDFSLRNALISALAYRSDRGFIDVRDVIDLDHVFRDASELVTFVDNHDIPRFLSISNDPDRFRLSLLLLLVSRGIPCLYYGGEQLLHCDTNGGNDPYNRPMMDCFEITSLHKDIAKLAALRRLSPAVQKGGMRTKALDADRWIVSRVYLGSVLLFAVNRSDTASSVNIDHIELPDGSYEDLLGGPSITVDTHKSTITLLARSIVVYHHHAPLPQAQATVDFQVHGICSNFGEEIYLCGDAPELGAWDLRKAVRMEYINAANWATTVPFDLARNTEIHYKYLIRRADGVVREPGRGHRRLVPKEGFAIWRDQWRQ